MATLTIEVPDELMERLDPIREQLPELLLRCLQPSTLTALVYRHIVDFFASQPTPEAIVAFRPTPEMQYRLNDLLSKNSQGTLTPEELQELDEYDQIEHVIILLKAGTFPYLTAAVKS